VHGLRILEFFSAPKTLAQAAQQICPPQASAQDWADLMGSIVALLEAGVLERCSPGAPPELGKGFGGAGIHIKMLHDERRTSAYLEAIRLAVRPGDVVVDIGSGTGVLAVAAAQAGARRVYALEASAIANAAQAVFKANSVDDRVTLMRGWSTQIELPEKVDLIVSEIIDNAPLAERVLEFTLDARRRFGHTATRFLPRRLNVIAQAVTVPEDFVAERFFTPPVVAQWSEHYGIDFSPLCTARQDCGFSVDPLKTRSWAKLSDPVHMTEIDFAAFSSTAVAQTRSANVQADGIWNGILTWFELDLGEGIRLSTAPHDVSASGHWRTQVQLFAQPIPLQRGQQCRMRYAYNQPDEPNGPAAA
jgi:SAM-dependent methyltransferase